MQEKGTMDRALARLDVHPVDDFCSQQKWVDRSVNIEYIDSRLRRWMDKVLGCHNREIRGRNGANYGTLLCLRESVAILQTRFAMMGAETVDSNENQDLCGAELVPFFLDGGGRPYSIRSSYLDNDEPTIYVVELGVSWGPPGNQRIQQAGIVPLSISSFFEVLAEDGTGSLEDDRWDYPPDSLILWPE
jgi:hypothetical protein